ncbi:MAG: hypothetical protein V3S29_01285 [bacterium]
MKESWVRKRGKFRNKHFMDVAIDGYIRDMALCKRREVDDLTDAAGLEYAEALVQAGNFPERGAYREIWRQRWQIMVAQPQPAGEEALMGTIEAAVREALLAEIEQRSANADVTIEDTSHYANFIAKAMGQLLEEASGEIEDMEEELP